MDYGNFTNGTTSLMCESEIQILDRTRAESNETLQGATLKERYKEKIFNKAYCNMPDISEQFKKMQEAVRDKHLPLLTKLLNETEFDSGYESIAEKYYNDLYEHYGIIADTILQNIYLQNIYENGHILKHLLFIISNLPENRRTNLEIVPLAGLSNPDIEIQDLSVKCFEAWESKRHILSLKKIYQEVDVTWFKNYIKEVIEMLEDD